MPRSPFLLPPDGCPSLLSPPCAVLQETDELLAQVRLVEAGGVRSALYSGGMKRRLSVAVALIGDPKVVSPCAPYLGVL